MRPSRVISLVARWMRYDAGRGSGWRAAARSGRPAEGFPGERGARAGRRGAGVSFVSRNGGAAGRRTPAMEAELDLEADEPDPWRAVRHLGGCATAPCRARLPSRPGGSGLAGARCRRRARRGSRHATSARDAGSARGSPPPNGESGRTGADRATPPARPGWCAPARGCARHDPDVRAPTASIQSTSATSSSLVRPSAFTPSRVRNPVPAAAGSSGLASPADCVRPATTSRIRPTTRSISACRMERLAQVSAS